MISISFIIPSYNSQKTVHGTLKSIFRQKSLISVKEVIVVDSSDDGETRKLLKGPSASPQDDNQLTFDSKLRIILLDKKTSPALGRNIGAQDAIGNLLCFIDSDVY